MKKLMSDFKAFAVKGNVIDMAIGVIIGAAFGKIVTSVVNDLLMPPLGMVLGKADFKSLFIALNGKAYASLDAAKQDGAPIFAYGNFLQTIFDFAIVAFVIFLVLKKLLPILMREKQAAPAAPTTKDCPECLSKIPLGAKRCAHCTVVLPDTLAARPG